MSQSRVFVPQEAVERWLAAGRADLRRDSLMFDGRSYACVPAVHFLAEVAGGADERCLVGRVKSEEQLAVLNAEHTREAVLLGDNAYSVVEGYLVTVDAETAGAPNVMARLVQQFSGS